MFNQKKKKEEKNGDWKCCGEIQVAYRKQCRNCGKDKPENSQVPLKKRGLFLL
jgi:hypothetical protein